jgi:microcystin-dependent protein
MKSGIVLKAGAEAVRGPRGLSIKELKYKETLANGNNIYQIILENNVVIGEIETKKGDKGIQGIKGDTGRGIVEIKKVEKIEKTNNWEIKYTDKTSDYISIQDGDNAFEVAVANGFTWEWTGEGEEPEDYGVKEWLKSLIGKGLEFNWRGTELGVRVEGEDTYIYTNLKGEKGDKGEQGAQGIKGEKGDKGDAGDLNAEISKIASTTQLGRIIVGDNLTIDEAGRLSGKKVDLSNYYDKPEIEEKFKNFCPFPINSIFLTLGTENPATLFLVTTWEKQEGRFLLGSNSAYTLGSTGGSSTTTLSKENLPNVKLQIDSFSLGKGTQEITGDFYTSNYIGYAGSEAFYRKQSGLGGHGGDSSSGNKIGFQASKSWTGMSTSAAPYTANMGDSTPFNNMPPYLVVNIWKRLS